MSRANRLALSSWHAAILHREHPSVDALKRQLELLHMKVSVIWPAIDSQNADYDVVFFDADMGHDEQFPWPGGFAPMPMVALIGSEAPGRIEWALGQGSNAHLLKPIGSTGAYSALLIATHAYEAVRRQAGEIRVLEERLRRRPRVVSAILKLMQQERIDETGAWKRMRKIAMDLGITIEEAADAICSDDRRAGSGM